MQCERLIGLAKSWYLHVRDETMAPARMVSFIKIHVAQCEICQADPDIDDEIVKITEIVLPKSKIPKAVRLKQEQEAAEKEYAAAAENSEEEDNGAEDSDEEDNGAIVNDDLTVSGKDM